MSWYSLSESTVGAVQTAVEAFASAIKTAGAAIGTKGIQILGSDGTNARIVKTNASGELVTAGSADYSATHGAAHNNTVAQMGLSDGTNARRWSGDSDGAGAVRRKDTAISELEDARSADHSGVPSGTDGVAVPSYATVANFAFDQLTGNGASTIPITLYGKLRGSGNWKPIPGASISNLDSQTDDIWLPSCPYIDIYSRVAAYTTGSAGTFTYDGDVVFS